MRQILIGGVNDALNNAATEYIEFYSGTQTWSTVGATPNRHTMVPLAGTLRKFKIVLSEAPGAGTSWVFTVQKNSVDTAIVVTISDTATSGQDVTNEVILAAGDRLTLKATVGSGTPANVASQKWSAEFEGSTAVRSGVFGGSNGALNVVGTTVFNTVHGGGTWSDTLRRLTVSPLDGTIKSFYVRLNDTPGGGAGFTFSIYKNGVEEASSVISINHPSTSNSVTGLSIDIVPGDELKISATSSGSPVSRNASWGIEIQPDTDGESILAGNVSQSTSGTGIAYNYFTSTATNWLSTEAGFERLAGITPFQLKNFRVKLAVAPGSGKSWDWTVRKNGADGNLTVNIADTATDGVDTTHVDGFLDGEDVKIKKNATNTPTSTALSWAAIMVVFAVNVNDTATATDVPTIQTVLAISKSDTVIVTESFAGEVAIQSSVFDTITITESVANHIPVLFISVFEAVTITESATPSIPVPDYGMQKRYQYKIYSKEGQFITTWNDVINDPSFTVVINGGFVEAGIQLARSTDDFGEESDVAFGNEVQIWCFDDDAPEGVKIFGGYISRYDPRNDGPADSIAVYVLGYHSQMRDYMYETAAGVTTIAQNSTDPGTIAENVILAMTRLGSRLGWTETTLQKTGTVVSYTFNTSNCLEAMDKILELCPAGWYWHVDANRNLNLHPKQELAEHTFTIGKEIFFIEPAKRTENVVNRIYFVGGVPQGESEPLFSRYERPASIAQYGMKSIKKTDQRVTLQATMDTLANNILDALQDVEIRTVIRVKDNEFDKDNGYDIESIRIGQTCQIRNYQDAFASSKWDVMSWDVDYWDFNVRNITETIMQIVEIRYQPNYVELVISSKIPNVSKRVEDINRNFVDSITKDNPTSPSIGVEI